MNRRMSINEVLAKLTPVFRDVFDDDRIVLTPEVTARDIDGWNSVANIRLMVTIEDEFHIKFDIGAFQEFRNVGDLAAGLMKSLG
jgi:acyl carrier protein